MSEPFFHEASETVRFWVQIKDEWVGASIRKSVLHYRYSPGMSGEDPLETYHSHASAIEDAVRRRVESGSREPVMLREGDLHT